MRTKTLLLTAALMAAGVASSMAQVYSVNAVGYVNLSIPKGFSMVANQFTQPSYTLGALIPNPPPSTVVYKYTPAGYLIYTFDDIDLVWYPDANGTIPLGSGVFVLAPSQFNLTFVGEVPQGTLTTPTPHGFSIVASQVPQAGTVGTLGLQGEPADVIYKYTASGYLIYTFDDIDLVWYPAEPNINVGEAFFLLKNGPAVSWTRNFTVN